jgi:ATP-dependent DNA helicase RecG
MEPTELLAIIGRGEDSAHQFKATASNETSLAQEFCAFSNSGGGMLLIGVSDDGKVVGLAHDDVARLANLVFNAASQQLRPPINPRSENVRIKEGLVVVVHVPDGLSKPYMDKDGAIWVKSGADKRKATSREELQRIFQKAGLVHADEVAVTGMTAVDVDLPYFSSFYERTYGTTLDDQELPLPKLLENMNLMQQGQLNLSAALLFAKNPQVRLPLCVVKAIAYPGDVPDEHTYLDSREITGKLADIFHETLSFVLANLRHVQRGGSVNSIGEPEIPRVALEELIANALIHRDYFVPSSVRVFVYKNRVEIISPGHLPNNLTVENIRKGNSNIRNPILASFGSRLLPYRGLGNGVLRALRLHPGIDFTDARSGNQFKVVVHRPEQGN